MEAPDILIFSPLFIKNILTICCFLYFFCISKCSLLQPTSSPFLFFSFSLWIFFYLCYLSLEEILWEQICRLKKKRERMVGSILRRIVQVYVTSWRGRQSPKKNVFNGINGSCSKEIVSRTSPHKCSHTTHLSSNLKTKKFPKTPENLNNFH